MYNIKNNIALGKEVVVMSLRSSLATAAGKSSYWLLHDILHRGGTSLPGKIATKLDPTVLKTIANKFDFIIITGTNGKTLTTALTTRVLREKFSQVITNPSGSNMIQGITGTLLTANANKSGVKPLAVLEVDEANVALITKYIKPKVFLITNIFRDQLDRYGEIYSTYQKIIDGIKQAPDAVVIANGDSPIFQRDTLKNQKIFYGFNHQPMVGDIKAPANTDGILSPTDDSILHYHYITYANLGSYFSTTDNFKRPHLTYAVTKLHELTPLSSTFDIDNSSFKIEVGGLYNIYNALAAYAVGRYLGVSNEQIHAAFAADAQIFGRQESIKVDDKEVTIVLVKNPVGANQTIDMIATENADYSLMALLNANYADGIDTSWIWDANFEKLHATNIKAVITGGERYQDFNVRLKMAGFTQQSVYPNLADALMAIKAVPTKKVYIMATYTAMLQLRALLAQKGYIKGGMGE